MDPDVKQVFLRYPRDHRERMYSLRELIFEVAESIEGVGEIEETMKWGEPAYLTSSCKSGTTIRIDWKSKKPNFYGVYFNCQTSLIETFRQRYKDCFEFEGNRAILVPVGSPLPIQQLADCIATALTYHAVKKKSSQK